MDPFVKYNRKDTNLYYKSKKKNKNITEIKSIYDKVELNKSKLHNGENSIQVAKAFNRNISSFEPFKKINSDQIIQQNHNSNISVTINSLIENSNLSNVCEENIGSKNLRKTSLNVHSELINNENSKSRSKKDTNGSEPKNQISDIAKPNMFNDKPVNISLKISNREKNIVYSNETKRHPLCCSWTFWHAITGSGFTNSLTDIKKFDTVEDFWSLVNHMIPPTQLLVGSDFSLFKSGVKPMWEDKMNENGCSIVITIKNDYDMEITNFLWLDTLLSLIDGQTYGPNFQQICGAVVSIRLKLQRISLWISNRNDKNVIEEIEKTFISYLKDGGHFSKRIVVNFKAHGH